MRCRLLDQRGRGRNKLTERRYHVQRVRGIEHLSRRRARGVRTRLLAPGEVARKIGRARAVVALIERDNDQRQARASAVRRQLLRGPIDRLALACSAMQRECNGDVGVRLAG